MKYIKIRNLFAFCATAVMTFSCSTDFIEEKDNYSSVSGGIYEEESLALGYVDYIYKMNLPSDGVNMAMWHRAAGEHNGDAGLFSKATDEVRGEVDINVEWSNISNVNAHCLRSIGSKLTTSSTRNDAWTRIRYCNLYLTNIERFSRLDEDFENQIKGQLYFWRAWQYFQLVRLYGGVPIILRDQGPNIDDPANETPRSSALDVINQIVSDLDTAKELLENARPYTEADAGRITAEAAAALKGRVLLTWASPMFNRNDDQARWQRAYDANLEAYNACLAAGKGLNPNWKNMWFEDNNMESIMSYGFNNVNFDSEVQKNNYTEHRSRAVSQGGSGGSGAIAPTKNIMDAFPMSDGTPYNPDGNLNDFYKNRDPRFYHTFAFNGSEWPYKEDSDFVNWTYLWVNNSGGNTSSTEDSPNITGIYLRKFTNDNSSNTNNFRNNGDDYMEIRFAEVVLNLAESAIGINNLAEGKGYIQDIRERAGIENIDGQYGLSAVSTRDEHFAACINERKVEFAYENKRFFDLRRWLLYNDDFGTVTRLNQQPIQGTRRQGYFVLATNADGSIYTGAADPFKGSNAPVVNRSTTTLDEMYENYFRVEVNDLVDPEDWTFSWYNEYYFFGIYQEVLDTAPYLQQTQGWGGSFVPYN